MTIKKCIYLIHKDLGALLGKLGLILVLEFILANISVDNNPKNISIKNIFCRVDISWSGQVSAQNDHGRDHCPGNIALCGFQTHDCQGQPLVGSAGINVIYYEELNACAEPSYFFTAHAAGLCCKRFDAQCRERTAQLLPCEAPASQYLAGCQ